MGGRAKYRTVGKRGAARRLATSVVRAIGSMLQPAWARRSRAAKVRHREWLLRYAFTCLDPPPPAGAMRTNLMEAKASVGKVRHPASYRLAETKGGKKGGGVWPKKATHSEATAMHAEDEDESESVHQKQLDHEKVALYKAKEAAFAATSALTAKQALDKALADKKKGIAHSQEYLNRLRAADAKARDNAKSFGIQQITDDEVSSRQNAARRQAFVAGWSSFVALG